MAMAPPRMKMSASSARRRRQSNQEGEARAQAPKEGAEILVSDQKKHGSEPLKASRCLGSVSFGPDEHQPLAVVGRNENGGNRTSRTPTRNALDARRNALTKSRHPALNADRISRVDAKHKGIADLSDILGRSNGDALSARDIPTTLRCAARSLSARASIAAATLEARVVSSAAISSSRVS